MDEAKIVEELKKRGYRVYKPEPKKEEFKPFKAIRITPYTQGPREVEVVRESRKRVYIKTQYGEREARKDEIYKHDPEALKMWAESESRADELKEQAEKLEDQASKIEGEAMRKIENMLKLVYEEKSGD